MGINLTEHYGLKKPEKTEFFDVEHQNENMDAIDAAIRENADAMLKKDGSVQMTGALKTIGSVTNKDTVDQIQLGNNTIAIRGIDNVYIAVNAYYSDGVWKRRIEGVASLVNITAEICYYLTGSAGIANSEISWVNTGALLTTSTGLPLAGGTVTGDITLNGAGQRMLRIKRDGFNTMAQVYNSDDGRAGIQTAVDNNNWSTLYIGTPAAAVNDRLMMGTRVAGVLSSLRVYHTGNITIGTAAPTTTLPPDAQHQVY